MQGVAWVLCLHDLKVVAELELPVVDASSGGQGGGHGRRERRVAAGMRAN